MFGVAVAVAAIAAAVIACPVAVADELEDVARNECNQRRTHHANRPYPECVRMAIQ